MIKTFKKFIKSLPLINIYIKNKIKIQQEKEKKARQFENFIIEKINKKPLKVLSGPFQNLKYINSSCGSALLPKLIGSYEEPIHDWIFQILKNKFNIDCIIDIGCAEGYYAIGFAKKLKDVKVIAFDIDLKATKATKEMKIINNVENVSIKNKCDHKVLQKELTKFKKPLIFCDIEGYENILLDPEKTPLLKKSYLLIEFHDHLVPNVSEKIIKRFRDTHQINITYDYIKRKNKKVYIEKLDKFSLRNYYENFIHEGRVKNMKFGFFKPIFNED